MLNSKLYDILISLVTWFNSSITDSIAMIENSNYLMYWSDKSNKRGGGILNLIHVLCLS